MSCVFNYGQITKTFHFLDKFLVLNAEKLQHLVLFEHLFIFNDWIQFIDEKIF
jgi:hypothetical protein